MNGFVWGLMDVIFFKMFKKQTLRSFVELTRKSKDNGNGICRIMATKRKELNCESDFNLQIKVVVR